MGASRKRYQYKWQTLDADKHQFFGLVSQQVAAAHGLHQVTEPGLYVAVLEPLPFDRPHVCRVVAGPFGLDGADAAVEVELYRRAQGVKWTELRYPGGDPENGPARRNPVDGCPMCGDKEADEYNWVTQMCYHCDEKVREEHERLERGDVPTTRPRPVRFYDIIVAMQVFAGKSLMVTELATVLDNKELTVIEQALVKLAAAAAAEAAQAEVEGEPGDAFEYRAVADALGSISPPQ